MNLWYVTRRRGELLIAFARVLFVLFGLMWIDRRVNGAEVLLAVSGIAAVAIYAGLHVRYFRSSWRAALQLFDLLLFTSIVHIAPMDDVAAVAGAVFLLFAAGIRYEWNGTLATGLLAACIVAWRRAADPAAILSRDLLVVTLIVIMTVWATAFGRYLLRKRQDVAMALSRSAWPRTQHMLLREQLENAAASMHAPRVALAWSEPGSRCELVVWTADEFRTVSSPLDSLSELTPGALAALDFFAANASSGRGVFSAFGRVQLNEPALDPALISILSLDSVLVARMESPSISGALIFADRTFDSDDLLIGRLAAEVIASRFDFFSNSLRRERIAAADERARVARDLHDGILQSLGGISMQLEGVGKLMAHDPVGAREVVRKIQDILAVDQHEIRSLVDAMRVESSGRQLDLRSGTRFSALAALVRMQWGADLDLRLDSLDGKVEKSRRREIHRLVREAVVNAAKHSDARRIVVEGGHDGSLVRVIVKDDGRGFPFVGRFDLEQLTATQQGPTSLKERVALLGGSLVIDSQRNGSTVEITIPDGATA
jgi:signal transduction histidine kinase